MANIKLDGCCYIKTEGGQQMLFMPDGTRVPGVVFTRVMDKTNEIPYVIVKLFIEIK